MACSEYRNQVSSQGKQEWRVGSEVGKEEVRGGGSEEGKDEGGGCKIALDQEEVGV